MNFIQENISIYTKSEVELVNITNQINNIIERHHVSDALINISTKHTTSSIIINEDEEGLKKDIINFYEKIVPHDNYLHNRIDNNARSHLKSILSTPNQTIPVAGGRLSLGTWQSIFFLELDGPRKNRTVTITIIN